MREDNFRRSFGRRARLAREAKGLTQRQVAEKAEIADRYLSRIEGGAATPSVFVALRIAKALSIGLDTLTDFRAEPERPSITNITQLLHDRSDDQLARVLRVVTALLE